MAFDALLGNDRLKENLAKSLEKNHISHFYLISGPAGSGKRTLANLLAAAILCRGKNRPCGVCDACRKKRTNNHPDVITVTDPDHKNVSVKVVRAWREDMFIRPNESDHKIYIFPQELGMEGQNALLKILEEPPSYGVFLLLADNPEKLLPTVRSRCTELKMQALPRPVLMEALQKKYPGREPEELEAAAERSGGFLGQALELAEHGFAVAPETESFVRALTERDSLLLCQTLTPMEKWKREDLQRMLQSWLELTEQALSCRAGLQSVSVHARSLSRSRTGQELYTCGKCLRRALECTMSNVSPAAVCGWLSWALRL